MSVPDEEFDDLDFEALEEAVRQSPKGHWFLDEYARRLRSSETTNILQAIAKLERVITSQDSTGSEAAPEPGMRPKQLRYFRQDEEIFVDAPVKPTVTAVEPASAAPEAKSALLESRGARLKITRLDQPAIMASGSPAPAPADAAPATASAAPAAVQPETTERKQRIIISRRSSSEGNFIPLIEEAAFTSRQLSLPLHPARTG